jgi:hypothetical protein
MHLPAGFPRTEARRIPEGGEKFAGVHACVYSDFLVGFGHGERARNARKKDCAFKQLENQILHRRKNLRRSSKFHAKFFLIFISRIFNGLRVTVYLSLDKILIIS